MRRLLPAAVTLAVTAFLSASNAGAADAQQQEEPAVALAVGDEAPTFQAMDDTGGLWKSADHVGEKILVVYFYPAAMTGGCTRQACGFRDDRETLGDMGAEVVGVSGDSVAGQALFKRAHNLNFTLLADTDGAVARAFGVPLRDGGTIERSVEGEAFSLTRGVTASRWTFVISTDGTVAYVNREVKAARDSRDVIAVVASLTGEARE